MSQAAVRVAIADEGVRAAVISHLEFVGERVVAGATDAGACIVVTDGSVDLGDCWAPVILVRGGETATRALPPECRVAAVLDAPLRMNPLLAALHAAARLEEQRRYDWPEPDKQTLRFSRLVGASTPMRRLRELMGKAAAKDVTVLVTGESGTGKRIVARSLHEASHRAPGPFVPVNCGAIPAELLESELFGHEKGAFAGAVSTRPGRFELADGGTLLLDEVSELPMPMQAKLLRVLQERSFERVGGSATVRCNVRIVAATHRDLDAMLHTGEFREDLYYRLNVFPLHVPALRERLDDVPALVAALTAEVELRSGDGVRFDDRALAALGSYGWPGNVRELANVIERLSVSHPGEVVGIEDLPGRIVRESVRSATAVTATHQTERAGPGLIDPDHPPLLPVNGIDLKEYMNRLEKSLIRQALDDTHAIVARAADRLHIRRTTLVEKMRKHGLQRGDAQEV